MEVNHQKISDSANILLEKCLESYYRDLKNNQNKKDEIKSVYLNFTVRLLCELLQGVDECSMDHFIVRLIEVILLSKEEGEEK